MTHIRSVRRPARGTMSRPRLPFGGFLSKRVAQPKYIWERFASLQRPAQGRAQVRSWSASRRDKVHLMKGRK